MGRSLIWIEDDQGKGWACSYCQWRSPIPTLLSDPEAKSAYDRLAAAKFREHGCEAGSASKLQTPAPRLEHSFEERVRALASRGYKPKDAVELALDDVALECRNDPKVMAKARVDAEEFLRKVRTGLI